MTYEVVTDAPGTEKVLSTHDTKEGALAAMRALRLEDGATAWVWDTERERVICGDESDS